MGIILQANKSTNNLSIYICNIIQTRNVLPQYTKNSFCSPQTSNGVITATERLLTILKGAAGLVPMASALYLSNLTRYTVPVDIDQPAFD